MLWLNSSLHHNFELLPEKIQLKFTFLRLEMSTWFWMQSVYFVIWSFLRVFSSYFGFLNFVVLLFVIIIKFLLMAAKVSISLLFWFIHQKHLNCCISEILNAGKSSHSSFFSRPNYHSLWKGFHTSARWWFITGIWDTASVFKSPGLFSVFWLISTMV